MKQSVWMRGVVSLAVGWTMALSCSAVMAQGSGIRVIVGGAGQGGSVLDDPIADFARPGGRPAALAQAARQSVRQPAQQAQPVNFEPVVDSEDDLGDLIQQRLGSAPIRVTTQPSSNYQALFGGGTGIYDGMSAESVLVQDAVTGEVLYSKNDRERLPIASITKLMTALVVLEAQQNMDDEITITDEDVDYHKHSSSRLVVGTTLTRRDMLHLALMSSENRAAHALARYYPGGLAAAVDAMNRKARQLGMRDTHYIEPTGLFADNQSTAQDLALLVREASRQPVIRLFSTSASGEFWVNNRLQTFRSTNRLVRDPLWAVGIQKTGYIAEAGRCMVTMSSVGGRAVVLVLLGARSSSSRFADAERVRMMVSAPTAPGAATANAGYIGY
ncbi:D-alanyl-D-alanine carboxypeptidase family protein [Amphibiibacter pelophylacis]|uniref:Serine hydrolase n=1 Tax=Amphibiibacter pelophylacis TaxID=1799477 RepID=A0ACC6NZ33_9BURK